MLLKSSSNPALNSWFQQQNPLLLPSPESDFIQRNFKSTTISLHSSSPSNDSPKKIARASSESDLVTLSVKRRNLMSSGSCLSSFVGVEEDVEAEEIEIERCGLLFSSSGLDVVDGGGGGGGGGGGRKICGGGDGGGSGDCCDGSDDADVHYRNMIESNPNNSLILANYAKYLKEVRGDYPKAEEYCSRAILANPNDGTALSMYADLIWETKKDASRAQNYFDQAIKASPEDCYVMASYARFLWDADEEEEDKEEVMDVNLGAGSLLQEAACTQQFPVAPMSAASWG